MQKLYNSTQIREAEWQAIEVLNLSSLHLMHKAGRAAFTVLHQRWPEAKHVHLFCGAGNNAGDGYELARLALAFGYHVSVHSMVDETLLTGNALATYQAYVSAGGEVFSFSTANFIEPGSVIIDALFGIGLNRPLADNYITVIDFINRSTCPVLALDIPSGLYADSGYVLGRAVKADVTVTFLGLKAGLFTGEAADYVGEIALAELDLPHALFAEMCPAGYLLKKITLPKRSRSAHKGHFGHVLLVGGNHGFSGAIRLAAEAALRSGAGLVSVATRERHSAFLNIARPEIMCHGVEEPEQLSLLLEKASVVVIGPGLGQDDWAQNLFNSVLNTAKPCVVDADALNLLAQQPSHRTNWLLTPHPGEAARLLQCTTADIATDRYAAVTALQRQFGGVCLLKGAGSLITDAEENIYVSTTGNPGLASGGTGDVLAGVLGALIAQGLAPPDAAKVGVYVHGQAADIVATKCGERGLLASDLLVELRHCLNTQ
jgi:NAD(P)H-hydrate epimerase